MRALAWWRWLRQPPDRPARPFTVNLMFAFVFFASFFDAWSTLRFMRHGAEEANPLMAAVIAWHDGAFWLIKVGLVPMLVFWLFLMARRHRLAWGVFVSVTVLHIGLTAMHQFLTHSYLS